MAVAYKSAGAGAGTETTGAQLALACPSVVAANDILIAHVIWLNITSAPVDPSGWDLLYGPANLGTGTAVGRAWVYGRLADGTEDGTTINFGTAGGTAGRYGRIYSFDGYAAGTLADVVPAASFSDIPSEDDPPGPTVTTTVTGALAVGLLAQDDNNTVGAWTGMSGGTWTRPVSQFTSTSIGAQGCMCAVNIATPTADPGTISGGAVTTSADEGSSIGFEIRPNAPAVQMDAAGASETDTAGTPTLTTAVILESAGATETDTAGSATLITDITLNVAGAVETDESGAATLVINVTLNSAGATEMDQAGSATLTTAVVLESAGAGETDTAGAATLDTAAVLDVIGAVESDSAGTVVLSTPVTINIGGTTETEAAGSTTLTTAVLIDLAGVQETDTAGTVLLTSDTLLNATGAAEADTAGSATLVSTVVVSVAGAVESDQAGAVVLVTVSGPIAPGRTTSNVRLPHLIKRVIRPTVRTGRRFSRRNSRRRGG